MVDVVANWEAVQERISRAAERVGRSPEAIKVIAVTKGVETENITPLLTCGIKAVGENRIQEALPKYQLASWRDEVEWHFIGHLQTNKVRQCLEFASLIHSVDRLRLIREIHRRALRMGLPQVEVLLQVNVSGETTKFGLAPPEVPALIEEAAQFDKVAIKGLMTIAPYEEDAEKTRPIFKKLRLLGEELEGKGFPQFEMKYLSMGMTNDFEVAIEEGANILRIGSAIFGQRPI